MLACACLELSELVLRLRENLLLLRRFEPFLVYLGRERSHLVISLVDYSGELLQLSALLLIHLTVGTHLFLQLLFEGAHESGQHPVAILLDLEIATELVYLRLQLCCRLAGHQLFVPELLLVIFDECPHGLVLAKKRSYALVLVLNDAADMVDCLSHLGHLLLLIVEMLLD